jgi:MFS family permease
VKTRGWIGLIAGVFLVAFMAGVWIWVAGIVSRQNAPNDEATTAFFGRTYLAFTLVILAGVLGIVNGIWQIRLGRPNRVLTMAVVIVFIAALGMVVLGLNPPR